jgi:hypothetical protein
MITNMTIISLITIKQSSSDKGFVRHNEAYYQHSFK